MTTVTIEFANPLNNGTERVVRKDGKFFINSKFMHGGKVQWFNRVDSEVSRDQLTSILRRVKAPADVAAQILAD
jgi:hypothetical protein